MPQQRLTIEIDFPATDTEGLVFSAGPITAQVAAVLREHNLACRHVTTDGQLVRCESPLDGDLPLSDTWQTAGVARIRLITPDAEPTVRARRLVAPELLYEVPGDLGVPTQRRSPLPIEDGQVFSIGRTREGNALRINDSRIARRHATITCQDGNYTLADLGTGSVTRLNERPVVGPVILSDGDRVQLGDTILVFADYGAALRALQDTASSRTYSRLIPVVKPETATGTQSILDLAAMPASGSSFGPSESQTPTVTPVPAVAGKPSSLWPVVLAAGVLLGLVLVLVAGAFGVRLPGVGQ